MQFLGCGTILMQEHHERCSHFDFLLSPLPFRIECEPSCWLRSRDKLTCFTAECNSYIGQGYTVEIWLKFYFYQLCFFAKFDHARVHEFPRWPTLEYLETNCNQNVTGCLRYRTSKQIHEKNM